MDTNLQTLQDEFKDTELHDHCEDINNAISYYDGFKDASSFMEWYKETYIDSAEIIYYHNAIKFLAEHDPSLSTAMEKAEEYGYKAKDLNSEILASLLLQDILNEEFEGMKDSIEEYFNSIEEAEEEEATV